MKFIITSFFLMFFCSSVLADEGSWTPHASFQLENLNLQQTMLFVSGMSYALSEYGRQLEKGEKPRLFCPTGKGWITSQVIFEILNSHFPEKKITTAQVTAAVFDDLRQRYPCKVDLNEQMLK